MGKHTPFRFQGGVSDIVCNRTNRIIGMKIDLYTKVVMTVIAVSLVEIAFTDVSFVNSASAKKFNSNAHPLVQKIAICDKLGWNCVDTSPSGLKVIGGS
jgi:hypothetical protein